MSVAACLYPFRPAGRLSQSRPSPVLLPNSRSGFVSVLQRYSSCRRLSVCSATAFSSPRLTCRGQGIASSPELRAKRRVLQVPKPRIFRTWMWAFRPRQGDGFPRITGHRTKLPFRQWRQTAAASDFQGFSWLQSHPPTPSNCGTLSFGGRHFFRPQTQHSLPARRQNT